jgi:hypothetical protein
MHYSKKEDGCIGVCIIIYKNYRMAALENAPEEYGWENTEL